MSLSSGLGIATRALQVNQTALSTISHNVANVNTAGYSRQVVSTSSSSLNGFGAGVNISAISRNVDSILQARITAQNSISGYDTTKNSLLKNVQGVFAKGDGSLENLTSDFFAAANTLANNTNSSAQKINFVKTAETLVNSIRETHQQLDLAAQDIDRTITSELTTINNILEDIQELNLEISKVELANNNGQNTSDLRDNRQKLVDELSTKMDISVIEQSNGSLSILSQNGSRLVGDGGYVRFSRGPTGGNGFGSIQVQALNADGSLSNQPRPFDTSALNGGSLKAMVETRDTTIGNLLAELDAFSATLATEFNKIHSRGTSVPPENAVQSGRRSSITNTTSDLYSELNSGSLANASFHLSVVNASTGEVVSTTRTNGPIMLPAGGPFSLDDLDTLIEGNADVAGDLTVTTGTDSSGNPFINIQANNGAYGVVLSNVSGDVLGELGMSEFFTGGTSSNIQVNSDMAANPNLISTAKMRDSDGGLSLLDNRNMLDLAAMADATFNFSAAGGLPATTGTLGEYGIQIISALAVDVNVSQTQQEFSQAVLDDMNSRNSSISGVNLDEELSNLIIFQNAFQANARVISLVDEMFDSLLSIV